MMIFNIEKYGDFDMPSTALIMQAPEGMTKKIACGLVKEGEELFADTNEITGVQSWLMSWGFTPVKTFTLTIGGHL